jgi:type VI protein secretion system component VasK
VSRRRPVADQLRPQRTVRARGGETAAGSGKQIQALSPDQTDPAAALLLLNTARAIPGGYGDRDAGAPWLMGFGLYQGDKLGGEAQAIYQRLLLQALLPRIILRLEERLRQNTGNPGYLYDTLKIYLMMDNQERFDAKTVKKPGWSRSGRPICPARSAGNSANSCRPIWMRCWRRRRCNRRWRWTAP